MGSSERRGPRFCGESTYDFINAAYCSGGDVIGWDRTYLLPQLVEDFGPMSAVTVLAHEYGHAIQYSTGIVADDDPGIVFEQQADCFAGAFMRHVAEGNSEHFELNTADGLNNVLASMVLFRDSDPNDPDSIHGSAFERVTAVQIGFTDGAATCPRIDAAEIESRRADLPQYFDSSDDGELPVTADSVETIFESFNTCSTSSRRRLWICPARISLLRREDDDSGVLLPVDQHRGRRPRGTRRGRHPRPFATRRFQRRCAR